MSIKYILNKFILPLDNCCFLSADMSDEMSQDSQSHSRKYLTRHGCHKPTFATTTAVIVIKALTLVSSYRPPETLYSPRISLT